MLIINFKQKNNRFTIKNTNGLTLIELMVTIAILSIIILGLVTLFSGGTRSWISGQNQIKAQREARQVMERIVREVREADQINTSASSINISFSIPISIGGGDDISFSLSGSSLMRVSGGTPIQLIENVHTFQVTYFNSNNVSKNPFSENDEISKINIQFSVDMDDDGNQDIILESDVQLRNYGLI